MRDLGMIDARVRIIASQLAAQDEPHGVCLTLRAFYRLWHSITAATRLSCNQVCPNTKLRDLVSTERRHMWEIVRSVSGISSLLGLGWFSPHTVGDLSRWTVAHAAKDLKHPGEPWTHAEIWLLKFKGQ
jgi:hypothetical protein